MLSFQSLFFVLNFFYPDKFYVTSCAVLSIVSGGLRIEFQKLGGWFVESDWKKTNCDGAVVLVTVERIITGNREVAKKFYPHPRRSVLM
ncbi:hypothetical protein T4E_7832 [Trichinella pseudospiralis]|uniref:Uncharacterized protein n=1 Tax=Trichinella pseudospiralis TaxID=6337 RepID=A0A0V0XGL3_TRIPS|nr:hypothetical protein T4E_7832 [Trichinella pseudospiralis]KRX87172.1 hypothetical protein T4E_7832 [Trichinella pseudospiralis]